MNLASYVHNSQKGFLYLPTLVVLPSSSDNSDTWEYNVKAVLKPEIVKPTPTGKPTGFVGTGDDMKLWPFYTAAAVSGVIFLCLAGNAMVDLVRRKRSRK